ncbi:MAG: M56 family metallopeptidase [Planctomycetota bacterium]
MEWLTWFEAVGLFAAVWFVLQVALLGLAAVLDRPLRRFEFARESMWRTALFGSAIAAIAFVVLREPVEPAVAETASKPERRLSDFPHERRVEEAVALSTAPLVAPLQPESEDSDAAAAGQRSVVLGGIGVAFSILAAFGLLRFGVRRARLSRRLRTATAVPADDSLLEEVKRLADRVGVRRRSIVFRLQALSSPIAVGTLRPRIYWPQAASELEPQARAAALAHELAHHRRRDPMWLGLVLSVESMWFWSPLVRLARHRLIEVSEWSADRIAAEVTDAVELAESLVTVASWSKLRAEGVELPACGMSVSSAGLSARVDRLLTRSVGGRKETRLLALAASITVSFTTTASLFSAFAHVDEVEVKPVTEVRSLQGAAADLPATQQNLLDALDVLEFECVTVREGAQLLSAEHRGDPEWSEVLSLLDQRLRDFEDRCRSLRARVRAFASHEPSDGLDDRRARPQMEK